MAPTNPVPWLVRTKEKEKDVKKIRQNLKLEEKWLLSQFQSKESSLGTIVFL